jgi:hypothetical protein
MKNLMLVLLVLLVLGGGVYFYRKAYPISTSNSATSSNSSPIAVTSPVSTGKTLFSDSPDAATSAVIFPGSLSDQAKTFVENFTMSTEIQSDGSTTVSLMPKNTSDEKPQTYNVKNGQKLYFIEKFPGDDAADKDSNIKDDYGVIVDADGFIVQ